MVDTLPGIAAAGLFVRNDRDHAAASIAVVIPPRSTKMLACRTGWAKRSKQRTLR